MSPWEKLLERPHPRGHFVQLYEADDVALTKNVGLYLWEGLRQGEGVLVIATPEHQELFSGHLDHLGANLPAVLLAWANREQPDAEWLKVQPNITSSKCDGLVIVDNKPRGRPEPTQLDSVKDDSVLLKD